MQKKQLKKTASRKQKQKATRINPALEALQILVGAWEMELSNADFLPNPSTKVKGHVSFEWLENGGFLVMRQADKPSGPPAASWVIGRDDAAQDYCILYFDSRGVSRRYEMSLNDGVWKIWRKAPGFSQRFQGKISEDGNSISAHWEKSIDGKAWVHDFDMRYTRTTRRAQ